MGIDDKVENAAERVKGHGKDAAGAATGDESLRAKGRGDKTKADVKDAGEQVKDAARKVGKAAKR